MHNIQKLSKFLQAIFLFFLIVFPLITILPWVVPYESLKVFDGTIFQLSLDTPEGPVTISQHSWTLATKSLGLLGSIVKYTPLFLITILLRCLFIHYKQGNIFTQTNVKIYQRLGMLFFINGLVATPLSYTIHVLAATLSNPPGHRYLSIAIGTPAITDITCGLIVIAISWVMLEATKLEDENKLTV